MMLNILPHASTSFRVLLPHGSIGGKTDTLLLGHWSHQNPPQLPHQRPWNKEGVKILGLFFGTEQHMNKNWEGLVEKVTGKLQRWKWIQAQLSYRGRVLVVNNLATSMLWHRLTVLDPQKELLSQLQKAFVDFFWGGHHWLPPWGTVSPYN